MAAYVLRKLGSDHRRHGDGRNRHLLLLRLAPGDPAAMIAGKSASAEMIAGIRVARHAER